MAAPHAAPPTTKPAPITLSALHTSILTRLAVALDAAAARLQSAAAGRSTFTSDADLKAALALLKLAPALLPLLQPAPAQASPPPAPNPPPPPIRYQIPLIPKCPLCNKGPGAHWAEDCPENPDRHLTWSERHQIIQEKGIKQ
ncbi:MAG: hypothetical protein JWN40_879 [Phycisphaerales bacterium]|nr:hypothetical protein [Phycisphaerales bacterium]